MPKNKPKKSKGRGFKTRAEQLQAGESASQSQDEETLSDTSSVATAASDYHDDVANGENAVEGSTLEDTEIRLKEVIEGLTEKNAKHRQNCLIEIRKAFASTWLVAFLENYQETLLDYMEKCLRKGKGEEQSLAADALAVVGTQVVACGEGERLFLQFKSILLVIISDKSASTVARTNCCRTLGLLTFMAVDEVAQIYSCMSAFETVFRQSYLKGDKSVPTVSPLVSDLHMSALSAWGLLLSVVPWSKVVESAESHLSKLPELLTSNNVMLRITAGETIALFYEIYRTEDSERLVRRLLNVRDLTEDLHLLATDSSKHRAKKDRRQQRSSFRDILRAVENGDTPEDSIKFGSEILYICSWTGKRQYSAVKDTLSTGMNFHLKENPLLRDIFELGPPLLDGEAGRLNRGSHFERHLYNQAIFKARSIVRGRQRDKRVGFGV
uniref:Interferon-related developmental regulator 2 n=1 Tax=Phallusia mammillata TaxID=59560 RepID=A0A6F9DF83_9ASCI|nr:interferon-related developmental regulator 2 [Phallusia mammillata]